jgi:hypothetical protein
MNAKIKRAALLSAIALGVSGANSEAATTVTGGNSVTLDGWTVSAPADVLLTLSDLNGTLDISKTADFTTPTAAFLITFEQSSATASPNIEFSNESIANNSGSAWSGFQFLLLNTTSTAATFAGLGNIFVPPVGSGYDYTGASLDTSKDTLTYTGSQNNGATSAWGGTTASDYLLIDANPAATSPFQVFALKELPELGGGGTTVPLPAAAWQSLIGLASVSLLARANTRRRRMTPL